MDFFAFTRAPFVVKKSENEHTQKVEENINTDENGADLYYQRVGLLLFFTCLFHIADTNDKNVSLKQGLSGVACSLALYKDPLCGGMLIC